MKNPKPGKEKDVNKRVLWYTESIQNASLLITSLIHKK